MTTTTVVCIKYEGEQHRLCIIDGEPDKMRRKIFDRCNVYWQNVPKGTAYWAKVVEKGHREGRIPNTNSTDA